MELVEHLPVESVLEDQEEQEELVPEVPTVPRVPIKQL